MSPRAEREHPGSGTTHASRAPIAPAIRSAIALLAAGALASCTQQQARVPGPNYPAELTQQRTLDIQVLRDARVITMTNTTSTHLPPGRLWLNKWFSRDMPEGFASGQTLSFDLGEFVDEFGEAFRGGGFFAITEPDDLVLAQYQILDPADAMLGLIVIDGRGE